MTRFRDLAIGQTFDFVDDRPERRMYNSFYSRCEKAGPRTYRWLDSRTEAWLTSRVGTINVEVHHVGGIGEGM